MSTVMLAAQIAILDLGIKQWVQRSLVGPRSLGPVDVVRSYNEGLVMGAGAALGSGTIVVVTAVITVVVAIMALRRCPPLAGGLLLGGALGNVLDRIPDGRVTDLLRVGASPVFNVADVSILIGFVALLLSSANHERTTAIAAAEEAGRRHSRPPT